MARNCVLGRKSASTRVGLFLWMLVQSCLSFQHSLVTSTFTLSSRHRNRKDKLSRPLLQENIGNHHAMFKCSEPTKAFFNGKSVLLTGASGGLGVNLAIQLAHCRVHDLVLSGRNEESLEKVRKECAAISDTTTVHIIKCDLTDRDSVAQLGERALSLCDNIDVLINNGGVSSRSSFLDTTFEVDERVMQINFFAGAALAKILVPGMVTNNSGTIIWVSSVQGLMGIPNRTSYAASKFAVQGYCEALRAELANKGITVHVASPGYIRTNLSRSAITGDGTLHGKLDKTTANGADPKEVAVAVLDKVAAGKKDFIVAATTSAKIAIWMRLLCPGILQKILVKRFEKSEIKEKED